MPDSIDRAVVACGLTNDGRMQQPTFVGTIEDRSTAITAGGADVDFPLTIHRQAIDDDLLIGRDDRTSLPATGIPGVTRH